MEHVFVFVNALIIPVIAAAFVMTAVWVKIGKLDSFYKRIKLFIAALLLASFFNFLLYYDYSIFNLQLGRVVYSIGWELASCFYVFLWSHAVSEVLDERLSLWLRRSTLVAATAYITGWLMATVFLYDRYSEIVIGLENIKQLLNLTCLVFCIIMLVKKEHRSELKYCAAGTALLLLEYVMIYMNRMESVVKENVYLSVWILLAIMIMVLVSSEAKRASGVETDSNVPVKTEEDLLYEIKEEYMLTNREMEIYRMILQGKSNEEIGRELFIGAATVKTHIHNLLKKLGAARRVEAVLMIKDRMRR